MLTAIISRLRQQNLSPQPTVFKFVHRTEMAPPLDSVKVAEMEAGNVRCLCSTIINIIVDASKQCSSEVFLVVSIVRLVPSTTNGF